MRWPARARERAGGPPWSRNGSAACAPWPGCVRRAAAPSQVRSRGPRGHRLRHLQRPAPGRHRPGRGCARLGLLRHRRPGLARLQLDAAVAAAIFTRRLSHPTSASHLTSGGQRPDDDTSTGDLPCHSLASTRRCAWRPRCTPRRPTARGPRSPQRTCPSRSRLSIPVTLARTFASDSAFCRVTTVESSTAAGACTGRWAPWLTGTASM